MSFTDKVKYNLKALRNVPIRSFDDGMNARVKDCKTAKIARGSLYAVTGTLFYPFFLAALYMIDKSEGVNEAIKDFAEYQRPQKVK